MTMRVYECDPSVEIIGQNMLAYIENLQASTIKPVLEQHGLSEINPQTWYSLQKLLNVLKTLADMPNASPNFVAIGMALARTAPLPPEIEHMPLEPFFLNVLASAYQMQHRGGDPGHLIVEKVAEKHLTINVDTPYPDDLEYGATYGFAKRLLPPGTPFTVMYDDKMLTRDNGGDKTLIHLRWE